MVDSRDDPTRGRERPTRYEIRIEGFLDERWSGWFDGMQIFSQPNSGITVMAGEVVDQAALHGLLAKVRDLGLSLISLRRMDPT